MTPASDVFCVSKKEINNKYNSAQPAFRECQRNIGQYPARGRMRCEVRRTTRARSCRGQTDTPAHQIWRGAELDARRPTAPRFEQLAPTESARKIWTPPRGPVSVVPISRALTCWRLTIAGQWGSAAEVRSGEGPVGVISL